MKKLYWLLVLVGVGTACQSPQSGSPVAQATRLVTVKLLPQETVTVPPMPPPIPVRFQKVLRTNVHSQPVSDTQQVKAFFQAHNLAPLLQTVAGKASDYALNGFRGSDQYRTEVVILTARRQLDAPGRYEITGLTRTKRRITGFRGQIQFDRLTQEPLLTADDRQNIKDWSMVTIVRPARDEAVQRFAVAGSVQLQEEKTTPTAGHFAGRLILELALTKAGRLRPEAPFIHGPSLGGVQRYAGTWTTYATNQPTPSVWVEDVAGDALFKQEEFLLGERDVAINPEYAKRGWNTLWENDEWWAASPKPRLKL